MKIKSVIHLFIQFFLPRYCALCQSKIQASQSDLCQTCSNSLNTIHNACPRCAQKTKHHQICGRCQTHPPKWQHAFAPFSFEHGIAYLIHQLKFSHQSAFAKTLAIHFITKMPKCLPLPDIIIPVPLHKNRLSSRGFNQSYLIAKFIGRKINRPVQIDICQRVRDTPSQTGLNAKDRQKNLIRAFVVNKPTKVTGQHIVIIDDVYTTGSTLTALCRSLLKHKPKQIDVWCIARSQKT